VLDPIWDFEPGDWVLFSGQLGAGKTTLIRALLRKFGARGPIRSPSYGHLYEYATDPPVVHADLYRSEQPNLSLFQPYLDTHVFLVEWGEHLSADWSAQARVRVSIAVEGSSRLILVETTS
jgi:tRNA threonylcarbamoyladenosine biosynthesis protein TsaE